MRRFDDRAALGVTRDLWDKFDLSPDLTTAICFVLRTFYLQLERCESVPEKVLGQQLVGWLLVDTRVPEASYESLQAGMRGVQNIEESCWGETLGGGALLCQPRVDVGQVYRLDFAVVLPNNKGRLAIEVDGFAYHKDCVDSFDRDQLRERALRDAGWEVMRFAARDVLKEPNRCAELVAEWAVCRSEAGQCPG